jgi:hypothetical protein
VLLTVAAGFLYFASVVWLGLAATYHGDRGGWYPLHLLGSAAVGAAVATGFIKMKRWSVSLFAAFVVALQVGYFFTTLSNVEPLVWGILVLLAGLFAFDRMT